MYECVVLGQQKQQPGHVTALATTITLLLGLVKHGYLEVPEEGSSGAGGVVSGLKTHVLSKLVGEGASDAEAAITVLTAMAEVRAGNRYSTSMLPSPVACGNAGCAGLCLRGCCWSGP